MSLVEGGFRTITGLIAKKDPASYQINTPVATIGVRGTDYVAYIHDGELYIGYNSGTPCVTGKDSKKTTVCLDKDHPYAKVPASGQPPVPVQEQPSELKQQSQIVQATIAPFQGQNSGTGTGGGGITSFCIQ